MALYWPHPFCDVLLFQQVIPIAQRRVIAVLHKAVAHVVLLAHRKHHSEFAEFFFEYRLHQRPLTCHLYFLLTKPSLLSSQPWKGFHPTFTHHNMPNRKALHRSL